VNDISTSNRKPEREVKMKRTNVLMAIMLFFAFGTITSHAGTVQKPPKDVVMLPDLTVKLKKLDPK